MRVKTPKKPQQKFLCHVLRLMLMLPGRVTFRNLSRYSPYHEKIFAWWFVRNVDFVSLNREAIIEVVPPSHEHVLAFDPSFVPKSGKHTTASICSGTARIAGRKRAWRLPRSPGSM